MHRRLSTSGNPNARRKPQKEWQNDKRSNQHIADACTDDVYLAVNDADLVALNRRAAAAERAHRSRVSVCSQRVAAALWEEEISRCSRGELRHSDGRTHARKRGRRAKITSQATGSAVMRAEQAHAPRGAGILLEQQRQLVQRFVEVFTVGDARDACSRAATAA
jgi:hypothetical protein